MDGKYLTLPNRKIGVTTLPQSAPIPGATAHGRVPQNGFITVEVDGATVVTCYTLSPATNTWLPLGAQIAKSQITFTAAGWDYFECAVNAPFYLVSSNPVNGYVYP